jgi:hypothetical protein
MTWAASFWLLLALLAAAARGQDCSGIKAVSPRCESPELLHKRDFFYIGGRYVPGPTGNMMVDQMYVEKLTPPGGVRQARPMVFFHGGGTSGVVSGACASLSPATHLLITLLSSGP